MNRLGSLNKSSSGVLNCPYTFMHDIVNGDYRLPWADEVQVTDGTSYGFEAPTRVYSESVMLTESLNGVTI